MKPLIFSLILGASLISAVIRAQNENPRQRRFPEQKAEWLDPNHDAPNGTKYQTFASKVLGQDVSFLVWLPPEYADESRRFPVIYWLHGMGANQRSGAQMFVPQAEAAMKEGSLPPCIIVLVNGMVRSFYCDSADGKVPMESVIMKDLIPAVDATYRTLAKREGRVIEGYSMGGYGAAHLGFKYQDIFGTVVINAAALIEPSLVNVPKDGPMFQVFGNDTARRIAEYPLTLAKQNAEKLRDRTRIRIGCGALDGLLPRNKELHDVLTELRIGHEYEVVPGVAHESPKYYRILGTRVYEFHGKALAR